MSHFTRIKTKMIEKAYLIKALKDLGHDCQVGNLEIRGYGGNRTRVEIKIPTKDQGYDIGFLKSGKSYEIIADWWGIKDINQIQFQQQVTQRYAYNAALDKLEEQGFCLVVEEQQEGERIHIKLRRMI